jgi:hypothetical protein
MDRTQRSSFRCQALVEMDAELEQRTAWVIILLSQKDTRLMTTESDDPVVLPRLCDREPR